MAKKYNNFRVGGSPNVNEDYAVQTNDLLERVIASKTVIQPGKSTQYKLINLMSFMLLMVEAQWKLLNT